MMTSDALPGILVKITPAKNRAHNIIVMSRSQSETFAVFDRWFLCFYKCILYAISCMIPSNQEMTQVSRFICDKRSGFGPLSVNK